MALKYGGKTISDYSAIQGPAPNGFHVPLNTEWQAVYDIWTALGGGSSDGPNFGIALKLPFAGYRKSASASVDAQGTYGLYWSSSRRDASYAYRLYFRSTALNPQDSNYRTLGYSVRCFKNSPTVPTSSWTKLYGTSIEAGGIFWSGTDGLISLSSDGQTWVTITDKNLGATTVWNSGDTLSETNCGKYYQWGNNYGFPFTGTIANQSTTQVDASNYGPGNYYSSDTFIKYNGRWDTTDNGNLRGGVTGIQHNPVDIVEKYYGGKLIDDYSAMRGPCPEGFHIATISERQSLMWTGSHLGAWNINGRGDDVKLYLRIPFAGIRFPQNGGTTYNGTNWQGYSANLWTSTGPSTSDDTARSFQITASSVRLDAISVRSAGYSVRPFKDVPVAPDSSWTTLYDGSSVAIGAGVFHNSTLGLISISGDGITWTTIADKNLGATIVYSNGDTLSQANCGNFYQWGNCYGFPFSGNVTTSGTQVNASTYGPRNYYTSSTFITRNSGSSDWSSVKNDNLWGGVTGIQQRIAEVKEVYYNTTKIWPFYPAGIYWNQSLGLISASSNGIDWVTITDKNLGATTVYNQGDTMNEFNCGKFYQRGNNYGFSFTGTPSRTSTKVNVSSYGPNNYYSSSTFVRVNGEGRWWTDASSTTALNLRGDITNTNEARRGPCPEGFHIPSHTEGQVLMDIPRTLQRLTGDAKRAVYKIPKCGFRDNYTAQVVDTGSDWAAWTTTQEATNFWWTMPSAGFGPAWGLNIRPFRNTAIIPTDEWVKLL